MKITRAQLEEFAVQLAQLAPIFSPANGLFIRGLVELGIRFQHMIKDVKDQTDPELWKKIMENFTHAEQAFINSVANKPHPPLPTPTP